MKRFFDTLFTLVGIIILSPILLIIMVLSLLFQGYPILFFHERLGINGAPFTMVKFRTMATGQSISASHDITRLTKWGKFLRRTSIDEFPVLINVIKGDMSLVGPRPLPQKYFSRFNAFQKKRFQVKPGITGLAQIKGRNQLSWEERFEFDVQYVNDHSFFLDIKIILITILLVFKGVGVTSKEQEIMPEFMGTKRTHEISDNSETEYLD
ncbi:MAG: sugar transferase [Candidatus Marinimicrobia bacterium]|jgi:sugar transferase EpsL|nr:sugar transferase [Candidatus Neomarinimicrobiota bacterium]MDP6615158.1 sugar transferase [Candidatus Neomarinimicrobiota bacterium]|tara:strand:+ start:7688 stop:8317 length:630 start_codon:yes stop_codon:yes gene_type:complete